MQILKDIISWKNFQPKLINKNLGFVPTMGNLHKGHGALIQHCIDSNDLSVVSIFVNPTQFNKAEDFQSYPKTLNEDIKLLESLGVDFLFLPDEDTIYNDSFTYKVSFENDSAKIMEDLHRPGHFTGVLTIVMKLLNIIKPQNCYLGEKDYQQLNLIKGMVKAFYMDTNIIGCDTIREEGGLAFSSRNNRLSNIERKLAEKVATIFHNTQINDREKYEQISALGVEIEYLENHYNRKFIAFKIGNVRLIDNFDYKTQEIKCKNS